MHQQYTLTTNFEIVYIVNILYCGFMKHYTLFKHKAINILDISHIVHTHPHTNSKKRIYVRMYPFSKGKQHTYCVTNYNLYRFNTQTVIFTETITLVIRESNIQSIYNVNNRISYNINKNTTTTTKNCTNIYLIHLIIV